MATDSGQTSPKVIQQQNGDIDSSDEDSLLRARNKDDSSGKEADSEIVSEKKVYENMRKIPHWRDLPPPTLGSTPDSLLESLVLLAGGGHA